jgi:nitroreductase
LQDCSAAIENILLAAHALGLGACWLGLHPRAPRVAYVREVLGIPESVTPISGISIGYPAETREPRTRYNANHVHRDKW